MDDPDEPHLVRSCDAVRCITQTVPATASIIVDESPAPNGDTAKAEELEAYCLSHIPANRLTILTGNIEANTKALVWSYVRRRIPGVTIATRRSGSSGWDRICTAVVGRMESLDFLDEKGKGDTCHLEIRRCMENQKKTRK